MNQTVAVLTDTNGRSSNFLKGSQFKIYRVNNGEFSLADTLDYHLAGKSSLGTVRRELSELEQILSVRLGCDSKFLVGSDVSGLPYNIFDTAGYTIFEISGVPEQFLGRLGVQLHGQQIKIAEGETIVYTDRPLETADGCYYFDLKTLQLKKPGITSKQALIPFFKEVPFLSLDIVCEHVPPWFDREFPRLRLCYTTKKADDALRVNVRHVTCSEEGPVSCPN